MIHELEIESNKVTKAYMNCNRPFMIEGSEFAFEKWLEDLGAAPIDTFGYMVTFGFKKYADMIAFKLMIG